MASWRNDMISFTLVAKDVHCGLYVTFVFFPKASKSLEGSLRISCGVLALRLQVFA